MQTVHKSLFMNYTNAFARELLRYQKVYDLALIFEDFLDLCLCVLSPSALAGFPLNRQRFESGLLKYSDPALPFNFASALALLLWEMKGCQFPTESYRDVLGDFYEEHILGYDSEDPFSSWDLDSRTPNGLRTILTIDEASGRKITMLDEHCKSGRRLLARKWNRTIGSYYGVDVNPICVKMSVLNLFVYRLPQAEIACIKEVSGERRFLFSCAFSMKTQGIVEIDRQEDSEVWQQVNANVVGMAA
jgi:hypothetical protein